ncbi:transcription factor HES-5-like isoform X1 [Polyodon spathula]|uniref:transcription factor HES-5-like isoform X1 n=2 Tax=Polyodon spathula TaxID=7913 RepID=UPI001B7ED77E|nr:transcription factor HES-5-like isoform X1 [Polyodon spathula]
MCLLLFCGIRRLAAECGKPNRARDPCIHMQIVRHTYKRRALTRTRNRSARSENSASLPLSPFAQTKMSPCNFDNELCDLKLTNKEKNKLRKPVVEKMRRDRINNSIEQLKTILEKEFQKHEPNSKLDKADVLEMTVSFLKQQLKPEPVAPQADYNEGYSRCLQETVHFVSLCAPQKGERLLNHFYRDRKAATSSSFPASPVTVPAGQTFTKPVVPSPERAVWRPW